MAESHDIYAHENVPFLSKRRKRPHKSQRLHFLRDGENAAAPAAPAPAPYVPEASVAIPAYYRHSRHSRRRHHYSSSLPNKLLWMFLAAVVLVYVAFLAVAVFKKKASPARSATPPVVETRPAPATPDAQSLAQVAEQVRENIRNWRKTPGVIRDARQAAAAGRMDPAVEALELALNATPRNVAVQVELARLMFARKDYARTQELALAALESDPFNEEARMLLATVLSVQGNHTAALAVADWILETAPDSVRANEVAAAGHLAMDHANLAIPYLRKLAIQERGNTRVRNNLGLAYMKNRQFDRAVDIFNALVDENIGTTVTYYNLAVAHVKQGRPESAVRVLEQAAGLYGRGQVKGWIVAEEFDSVRANAAFKQLTDSMESIEPGKGPSPSEYLPLIDLDLAGDAIKPSETAVRDLLSGRK